MLLSLLLTACGCRAGWSSALRTQPCVHRPAWLVLSEKVYHHAHSDFLAKTPTPALNGSEACPCKHQQLARSPPFATCRITALPGSPDQTHAYPGFLDGTTRPFRSLPCASTVLDGAVPAKCGTPLANYGRRRHDIFVLPGSHQPECYSAPPGTA